MMNKLVLLQRAVPPFRQSLSRASKISLEKKIDVSAPQGTLGLWRSKNRLHPQSPPTARSINSFSLILFFSSDGLR